MISVYYLIYNIYIDDVRFEHIAQQHVILKTEQLKL